MTPPRDDEVEISVFGPGYGESILVHVGSRRWIVIDSCLADDRRTPAPLKYMSDLGLDASTDVCAVVATHWHDDHIKGLSTVLRACAAADFWHSATLTKGEFLAFLAAHDNQPTKLDRGGTEMLECIRLMNASGRKTKRLLEDTLIADWPAATLAHGRAARLLALSPSSKQFDLFLRMIGAEFQALPLKAKKRLTAGKNDLSIASVLEVGDLSVLLGADLEYRHDPDLGWAAVIHNRSGKGPKSSVIKIPHHGSEGAHHCRVWSELLAEDVISVVTPWGLAGKRLPTETDKARISGLSKEAYITAEKPQALKRRYPQAVTKQIRTSRLEIASSVYRCGHVRIRFPKADVGKREVKLFNGAARY